MSLVEKKVFVNSNLDLNANKFWTIERFSDHSVKTTYGRIGSSGESTTKKFPSEMKAKAFFTSKIKSKLKPKEGRRDAYTEITLAHDKVQSTTVQSRHLPDLAVEQIQTTSEEVRQLIRYLAEVNIHNILSSTTIKYNSTEGLFSTPLGVVDKTCVDTARDLLTKIVPYANAKNLNDPACKKLINQYLRMIPQSLGGSHVKINANNIFGSPDLLIKQENIIEGLEVSVQNTKPEITTERLFDVEISPAGRPDVVVSMFGNPGYSISNVYNVKIKSMEEKYNEYTKEIDNKNKLFHGTNAANVLSILKSGLVIRKGITQYGRFGEGLYFSDKSSMSLGYASQYKRSGKNVKYMFISEVAMGKVTYSWERSALAGYNSRWMEKGLGSSQVIIYNEQQANILYLLELTGV